MWADDEAEENKVQEIDGLAHHVQSCSLDACLNRRAAVAVF